MFAVVANGIQTICQSQRELDTIIAIYPYPKFSKVRTREEGREWLRRNKRSFGTTTFDKYGNTARWGFAQVKYEIREDSIFYDIDTSKVGHIRVCATEDTAVDSRSERLRVSIRGVKLDNDLIMHHAIAVRRILKLLGEFIDVDIVVPDISVYLALTKYSGTNYMIRGTQHDISSRLGGVSFTVAETIDYKKFAIEE